jgi:hypothetical protein
MKTKQTSAVYYSLFLSLCILFFTSCKKDNSVVGTETISDVASSQAIGVGISSATNDSIYVVGACARDHVLDSLAQNAMPSTITDYLTTNYAGYTFEKAFTEKDSSGTLTGYVVIIRYNANPVGLKFDASGNFVRVLEQRDERDLNGRGYREGGCFSDRDGMHKDTVGLSALPPTILSYFTTNYPQDTLVRAYVNADSSYIVFSIDNGSFAIVFSSSGTFIRRVELHQNNNKAMALNQSDLPVAAQTYLTTTYPNYVFKQAFSFSQNGNLLGYVVVIDANNTKYAVQFDASGNFIGAITIW